MQMSSVARGNEERMDANMNEFISTTTPRTQATMEDAENGFTYVNTTPKI